MPPLPRRAALLQAAAAVAVVCCWVQGAAADAATAGTAQAGPTTDAPQTNRRATVTAVAVVLCVVGLFMGAGIFFLRCCCGRCFESRVKRVLPVTAAAGAPQPETDACACAAAAGGASPPQTVRWLV
ncbi:hypothetical protein MNEG_6659 [Monoraphidium neglectum]|uniref:Uncharacterized protein n=1 Tax=Monoraphidium neglectum TaxID=145388 RepID=A0A0D2L1Y8_9CHLO|nr:hypothetical protein MNEG_6659 [Monoraphidium neglectum]KIZ01304.1 hypothetical protein MNEG_6659 [Monoraphidium neglectum]|eukprot:XP_013900323.1 hypothetical protein MNEG_6659 [Monoraphidium neglectum]